MSSNKIAGIVQIIDRYEYFIIDLWGVVHDGSNLYPYSLDAIKKLALASRKVIFLSNAPRRKQKVIERLDQFGIGREYYHDVVTSGELVYRELQKYSLTEGRNYYFIGENRDLDLLDGLDYQIVSDMKNANFILCTDLEEGQLDISEELKAKLSLALAKNLILLCANPDINIVKQTGETFYCAGYIGDYYSKIGGRVMYFGKPYHQGYDLCLELFDTKSKEKVVAIGDSFHTDITGAYNYKISSILIMSGIHNDEIRTNSNFEKIKDRYAVCPTYHTDFFSY
jgi:HAD superfamily hydrolase (TIGR01459 family)